MFLYTLRFLALSWYFLVCYLGIFKDIAGNTGSSNVREESGVGKLAFMKQTRSCHKGAA